jgi:predicted secreted protein
MTFEKEAEVRQAFEGLDWGVAWLWRMGLEPGEIAELASELAHEEAADTERYRTGEALARQARQTRETIARCRGPRTGAESRARQEGGA